MIFNNRWVRRLFNRCCQKLVYNQLVLEKLKTESSMGFSYHLTFDIDLREDHEKLPMVLDNLEGKATFAVVGKWVEREGEIYREIVKKGHELINHTYSHPYSEYFSKKRWKELTEKEKLDEIARNHKIVKEKTGYVMKGFRMPHFGDQRDSSLPILLERLGYSYSSSLLAVDANYPYPYRVSTIWEIPLAVCPYHPFTALDSYHAVRRKWHKEPLHIIVNEVKETYLERNLPLIIYVDPVDMDEDLVGPLSSKSQRLETLLERLKA